MQNACSYLEKILLKDKHSLIRKDIIKSVLSLTSKYLEKIEEWLSNLISTLMDEEKEELIDKLINIYEKQKREQNLTTVNIETIMKKWAIKKKAPAQQIAIKALVSFAKIGGVNEYTT